MRKFSRQTACKFIRLLFTRFKLVKWIKDDTKALYTIYTIYQSMLFRLIGNKNKIDTSLRISAAEKCPLKRPLLSFHLKFTASIFKGLSACQKVKFRRLTLLFRIRFVFADLPGLAKSRREVQVLDYSRRITGLFFFHRITWVNLWRRWRHFSRRFVKNVENFRI